ncbi:hypothetical protein GX441_10940 [bacterium]|nr:hypothetical protein [bacterium]
MKGLTMLEEYTPVEAQRESELHFLDWAFLIQQVAAVSLLLVKLLNPSTLKNLGPALDVISQNANGFPLIIFIALHLAAVILILFVKRPVIPTIIWSWLGLMTIYSVIEFILGEKGIANLAGIGLSALWGVYFLFSKRIKIRYFYKMAFNNAVRTIICPRCKKEVFIDTNECGDILAEDETLNALQARIGDIINVPSHIRAAQIELTDSRFGSRALGFFKELYQKEIKSLAPNAQIASALMKVISKYPSESSPKPQIKSKPSATKPMTSKALSKKDAKKTQKPSSKPAAKKSPPKRSRPK